MFWDVEIMFLVLEFQFVCVENMCLVMEILLLQLNFNFNRFQNIRHFFRISVPEQSSDKSVSAHESCFKSDMGYIRRGEFCLLSMQS